MRRLGAAVCMNDVSTKAVAPTDYLAPDVPGALPWQRVPLVRATEESLRGYGHLVDDHRDYPIEIVTWPQPGWRPMDTGTGNEGGTTTGIFDFWWEGETLFGTNQAVAENDYLLGWSCNPVDVKSTQSPDNRAPDRASFHDEQGKVHARISCNFATEFGVFLEVPLAAP